MSALAQKFENGLCRCCLSEGLFKSLSDIDCSELQQEIFAVTLKNCFSISLSPMFGQYSETTYGICDMCIYKLREANSFKNLVQESETKFQQLYSNHIFKELDPTPQFKDEKVIEKPPMKRPKVEKNIEEIVMPSHVDMDDDDDVNDGDGDDHDNADDDDANDDSFDFNFDDSDDDDKTLFDLRKAKPTPKKAAKKKAVKLQDIEKKPEEKLKKGKKAKTSVEPKTKADKEKPADAEATERPKVVKRGRKSNRPTYEYLSTKNGDQYLCGRCNLQFPKKINLWFHIRTKHYNILPHRCKYCPMRFGTDTVLDKHLKEIHGLGEFKCSSCNKEYANRRRLREHFNNFHKLGKIYKCTSCEYESHSARNLKDHKNKHATVRSNACIHCSKTFASKKYLAIHERTHTQQKLFTCQLCDKKYFHKSNLKYHSKTRHPEIVSSEIKEENLATQF